MNAQEMIESYVTDVAVHLPRKQRNDVAFELRALLNEELQAKAEAAGHHPDTAADAALAAELLQAFGRPKDVAARYRPTLVIIDPADGHRFLRATLIGLAVLWGLGLWMRLRQPIGSGSELLGVLGQWWTATVISSLWWPGLLVLSFGMAAWARRRAPRTSDWKPRAGDRIPGGRASLVLALAGILCGVFVLLDPRWVLDVFLGGRAAPAAYEALTYTETFRRSQAPILLVLLLLNLPLYLTVIAKGRWTAFLRRVERGLGLLTCAVMTWTVLDGPVFLASSSDQMFKLLVVLIIAAVLINLAVQLHRSVKPGPNRQMQTR